MDMTRQQGIDMRHNRIPTGNSAAVIVLLIAGSLTVATAQAKPCDMAGYTNIDGLSAIAISDGVQTTWQGEDGNTLRADFSIRNNEPVVTQLAVRKHGGNWITLANNVTPEFQVTTGKRRISTAQMNYLKRAHLDTSEEIERRKWFTFWDAPLAVPGNPRWNAFLPRKAGEIRRGTSTYRTTSCHVSSKGTHLSVSFNGLTLGIFSGGIKFTIYKGSSLLRQEAIAKTSEPSVAYIYKAGLKGFAIMPDTELTWRDDARGWQNSKFGGAVNQNPVNLRARNRLEVLKVGDGSLAVFPTPHQFFFARENEVNLGYVYYRKDSANSFSLGIMQPERGEGYKPWGISDAVWNRRAHVAREQVDNFALYNAPAGTKQHMSVYYYLSAADPKATSKKVLAYTHNDVYKPLSGFKVLSGHYHMDLNEMVSDRGNLDYRPTWVPVLKGLGINLLYLGDFHDDSHQFDPGPIRLPEQKVYFEASAKLSDKDFLVMPAEEVNSFFGGHWYLMLPKPIYFTHPREPSGKSFVENDPAYGQVYNLSSAKDAMEMINREGGVMWTAHPRTKSSEGYPEAYKDKDFFLSDRFIGASWEALPVDLSEKELCQVRCFDLEDEMSNWAPKPKFMIAEGDTYMKSPEDETYPQMAVNYLKLDHVPAFNESWAPVLDSMRAGNFFGTTGEILFHNWGVSGSGTRRTLTAEVEYTYPLDFAELVWSDGKKVNRQVINLSETIAFGTHKFSIPFEAKDAKWVRLSVWDVADNGAWIQPISLK
jgi:hypothetical protein